MLSWLGLVWFGLVGLGTGFHCCGEELTVVQAIIGKNQKKNLILLKG